jgi:phage terminase small subunit
MASNPLLNIGKPPAHLSDTARTFWVEIVSTWQLEAHQLELLRLAAEALDRCEEARRSIAKDGLIVEGRYGPRQHPAAAIERDSRLAFARLVRELGLPVDDEESRPPPPPGRYVS